MTILDSDDLNELHLLPAEPGSNSMDMFPRHRFLLGVKAEDWLSEQEQKIAIKTSKWCTAQMVALPEFVAAFVRCAFLLT